MSSLRAALVLIVAVAALTLVASASGAAPRFVRNIETGQTGWFSSPALVDLGGDRRLEIVAPFHSTFVFDHRGRRLGEGTATEGRVYARGGRRPRRRRGAGDRGRRQRGDGGGVPRSSAKRLPWPTARGNLLRNGAG